MLRQSMTLLAGALGLLALGPAIAQQDAAVQLPAVVEGELTPGFEQQFEIEIGRASCRERVLVAV